MVKAAVKWMLRQLLRVPAVRQYVETQVATSPSIRFAPPGDFSSPLPDLGQVEQKADRLYSPPSADDGVELNADKQRRLLVELAEYYPGFDWGEQATPGRRFFLQNNFFGHGDAVILYAMIRHFRPRRIIEVGSGFSSALMLDTNGRYGDPKVELCFIEPYPDRLTSLLTKGDETSARLITSLVQDVPLTEFDALGPNDFLFIDSSHVAKVGSDVNHLFFSVLPRLRSGVLIHIHDVFYPFEYPLAWFREGRAWNELYFLRAFLQCNHDFEIVFFNSFLSHQSADLIREHLPLMSTNPGGSIWLRKTGHAR